MTRREVFERLRGFDERYFMFFEDVDYCWRALLAGHDVVVAENATVVHQGGGSAPGGYPTAGGITTTSFRIGLRERNAVATMLKCYGGRSLAVIIPLVLLQIVATAAALFLAGNRAAAREVIRGVGWNIRELPVTLRARRQVQRSRKREDAEITRRMAKGLVKLQAMRRWGFPRVDV